MLTRDPADHDARVKLAVALAMSGRVGEAINHLHQVLDADPKHAGAHYNLGLILLQRKEVAAAASDVRSLRPKRS